MGHRTTPGILAPPHGHLVDRYTTRTRMRTRIVAGTYRPGLISQVIDHNTHMKFSQKPDASEDLLSSREGRGLIITQISKADKHPVLGTKSRRLTLFQIA